MKKRIFTLALALLVMSLAVPAAATQTITTSESKSAELTYTVVSTYTVTIPASVSGLTKSDSFANLGSPVTVAAGMLLNVGQRLTVKLFSTNVADSKFYLVLDGDTSTKVPYSIQKAGELVAPAATTEAATTILSVAAGVTTGQTAQLQYKIDGMAVKSGEFKDTLTFVVGVSSAS